MSIRSKLFLIPAILTIAFAGCAASAAPILKDSDCLDCHGVNTLFKTNSAGKAISLFVDKAKLAASAHGTNSCFSCHADVTMKHPDDNKVLRSVNCATCHPRQTESYGASVHGLAVKSGQ